MHLDDVLTELVEHSGDRLLRVAYQLTHDAAAAQDLVQRGRPSCLPVSGLTRAGPLRLGRHFSLMACTWPGGATATM